MSKNTLCPCGSTLTYAACCEPFHKGKKSAPTAEALLRSRYCAFVKGEVDYIVNTHHSKTSADLNRKDIESWSKDSEWIELKIMQKFKGEASDTRGEVIFNAQYKSHEECEHEGHDHADHEHEPELKNHLEHALFEKEDGNWKFLDAQEVRTGPIKRDAPKTGRNDPCPCKSGKKYKKCCEQAA